MVDDVKVQRKVSKLICIYCCVVVLDHISKKIDLRCECISMASVECHIVENLLIVMYPFNTKVCAFCP